MLALIGFIETRDIKISPSNKVFTNLIFTFCSLVVAIQSIKPCVSVNYSKNRLFCKIKLWESVKAPLVFVNSIVFKVLK